MSLQIACSIVLYNNDVLVLAKAIDSVLQSPIVGKLYLIDNSPQPLYTSSRFSDSRVEYVFMNKNEGYGAGHNVALRKSIAEKTAYHLVLNPDVYFEKGTLEAILSYAVAHPKVGNIMPKVYYPNGELQYLCKLLPTPYDWIGRRFNPIKKMVARRNELFELRFMDYDCIAEVPYLSGCFMFLNVSALQKIGLFDERIFMYGEETDLCRRLIDAGFSTVYFPEAHIFHGFAKGSHRSLKLTKIGMQSAIYYFNKWGWFFDKKRSRINKETLRNLSGNNSQK